MQGDGRFLVCLLGVWARREKQTQLLDDPGLPITPQPVKCWALTWDGQGALLGPREEHERQLPPAPHPLLLSSLMRNCDISVFCKNLHESQLDPLLR